MKQCISIRSIINNKAGGGKRLVKLKIKYMISTRQRVHVFYGKCNTRDDLIVRLSCYCILINDVDRRHSHNELLYRQENKQYLNTQLLILIL